MTPITPTVRPLTPWYLRPRIVLPTAVVVVVLVTLFAPDRRLSGRSGDSRLTTYSADPMGGRVFFELAGKLGWQVVRRGTPAPPTDVDVIHAVLAAEVPFRRDEVHEMLQRVRDGAGLLLVANAGTDRFKDSLDLFASLSGYAPAVDTDTVECANPRRATESLWFTDAALLTSVRWIGDPPFDLVTFVSVTPTASSSAPGRNRTPMPSLAGFSYGRGRIVVTTDPDVFRNDALRVCEFGLEVPAVRALEYLRDGGDRPRTRIIFDEFHHDLGEQPGSFRIVTSYLVSTKSGHVLAQLCAAGLILLAALAPRAVAPREVTRIERRSPFEHVDALARAYAQVGATRTAASRLVRGVRRRVERGAIRAPRDVADDAFLERVVHAVPALAPDVALVRRALASRIPPREFARFGEALERLEHSLLRI